MSRDAQAVFVPDNFQGSILFTRIRAILIETPRALPAISPFFAASAASNSFIGPMNFGAQIRVRPGCTWAGIAPNADGWPVIAGTGDVFFVTNQSAGNINYSIVLVGTT